MQFAYICFSVFQNIQCSGYGDLLKRSGRIAELNKKTTYSFLATIAVLGLLACSRVGATGAMVFDSGVDSASTDADTDGDTDTDSDTDSDSEDDTDTGCGTDCYELAWIEIPGGTFLMGSNEGEPGEMPVHEVTVPSFEMTRTEVTVAQYETCVVSNVCAEPSSDGYCSPEMEYRNWGVAGREHNPVNCVDWKEAVAFCTMNGWRLPSEAEWEYAARSGGVDIKYPWGAQPASCSYAVMNDGGDGCGLGHTAPVCSKMAGNTDQGLCDMAGNVWEWVRDCYGFNYQGTPTDGSAMENCPPSERMIRGGGFGSLGYILRTTNRLAFFNDESAGYLGFRCAR
jgi:formylglycine-generating enzyme required for sulfatase activity